LFHENKVNYPASDVFDSVDAVKDIYNGALNTLPFHASLAKGAIIDAQANPELQEMQQR
jgi:hypothetical protein